MASFTRMHSYLLAKTYKHLANSRQGLPGLPLLYSFDGVVQKLARNCLFENG